MKRLIVNYDYVSGEDETCCEVLISGTGRNIDVVHKKFKDFFGSETETQEKGYRYLADKGYPAIKIRGYREVPVKDWAVLKNYLIEI